MLGAHCALQIIFDYVTSDLIARKIRTAVFAALIIGPLIIPLVSLIIGTGDDR